MSAIVVENVSKKFRLQTDRASLGEGTGDPP